MKTKKIKLITALLLLLPLCVSMLEVGCEKDGNGYGSDSIIGKWKWLYTYGGFAGITYPEKGKMVIWRFTKDSTLIVKENQETTLESDFNISGDTLTYLIEFDLEVKEKYKILNDTLSLYDGTFKSFYKRIE